MESVLQHFVLPLIVTVAGGLIVGLLLARHQPAGQGLRTPSEEQKSAIESRVVTVVVDPSRYESRVTGSASRDPGNQLSAAETLIFMITGVVVALVIFALIEPVAGMTVLGGTALPIVVVAAMLIIARTRARRLALPSAPVVTQFVIGVIGALGIGVALLKGRPGGRTVTEVGASVRAQANLRQSEGEGAFSAFVGVILNDMTGIGYALVAGLVAFMFGLMLVWLAWADVIGFLTLQQVAAGSAGAWSSRLAADLLTRSGTAIAVKLIASVVGLLAALIGLDWLAIGFEQFPLGG